MPVTPSQARKFANERIDLLKKIDKAILTAYSSSVPEDVKVEILENQYNAKEIVSFLEKAYSTAGWKVNFEEDPIDDNGEYHYFVVLKEKPQSA